MTTEVLPVRRENFGRHVPTSPSTAPRILPKSLCIEHRAERTPVGLRQTSLADRESISFRPNGQYTGGCQQARQGEVLMLCEFLLSNVSGLCYPLEVDAIESR